MDAKFEFYALDTFIIRAPNILLTLRLSSPLKYIPIINLLENILIKKDDIVTISDGDNITRQLEYKNNNLYISMFINTNGCLTDFTYTASLVNISKTHVLKIIKEIREMRNAN